MARQPIWRYDIESLPVRTRLGVKIRFYILRNDGKKFGPFQSLKHTQIVRNRFAAWALQPWPRSRTV